MTAPATSLLEERMIRFLEAQPGAENVEKLVQTSAQKLSKQVDFFLNYREVLCELKSIQTSTAEKVDALIQPILDRPNAPVFYGSVRFDKLAKHFPDGDEILREAYKVLVSSVQTFFRKANQQIRSSKIAFNLPAASGGLVVVNDRVSALSPEVMFARISELLRKRTPEGAFAFPEIDAVLLIDETHVGTAGEGVKGPLTALVTREASSKAEAALEALMPAWAKANGYAYQELDPALLATLPMQAIPAPATDPRKMTRQGYWEKQYRKYPYLRWHTKAELSAYFRVLMESFAAGALKGATPTEKALLQTILEHQTHFMQEAEERGIDYRTLGPMPPLPVDQSGRPRFRQATIAELQALMIKAPFFEAGRFYTNEAGDCLRCVAVTPDQAQAIRLVIRDGKNVGVPLNIPRAAWSRHWPIVDERLIGDLEKRYSLLKQAS
ncbi:MAG TPA: hypothetical protein VG734_12425 [Lacunisphaera sp.]|nr:hypothetical protein [Lacunisphaera sp.]